MNNNLFQTDQLLQLSGVSSDKKKDQEISDILDSIRVKENAINNQLNVQQPQSAPPEAMHQPLINVYENSFIENDQPKAPKKSSSSSVSSKKTNDLHFIILVALLFWVVDYYRIGDYILKKLATITKNNLGSISDAGISFIVSAVFAILVWIIKLLV